MFIGEQNATALQDKNNISNTVDVEDLKQKIEKKFPKIKEINNNWDEIWSQLKVQEYTVSKKHHIEHFRIETITFDPRISLTMSIKKGNKKIAEALKEAIKVVLKDTLK